MSLEKPRYLLVKHSQGWNVDRVCSWLQSKELDFDWCYPADGEKFPDVGNYSGVVVFGGASSANDCTKVDWVKNELAFIESALRHDVRFFGICLGAQMLARVLGSAVKNHPGDLKEVGFHQVFPTPESGKFLTGPLTVMQWHSEGFETPEGCVRVAEGALFPNQAFRQGANNFGVQFHPEVNPAALAFWHERNSKRDTGRLDPETRKLQMEQAINCDAEVSRWLDDFMHSWTDTGE